VNTKVILNYALLILTCIGLAACGGDNDVNQVLTFEDLATTFSGDTAGTINEGDTEATGTVSVNDPNGQSSIVA